MTIKELMGITNPRLTNKQIVLIVWFGISAIIATLVVCFLPAMPTWLQFATIIPTGLNFLASATALPSSGIDIKE